MVGIIKILFRGISLPGFGLQNAGWGFYLGDTLSFKRTEVFVILFCEEVLLEKT